MMYLMTQKLLMVRVRRESLGGREKGGGVVGKQHLLIGITELYFVFISVHVQAYNIS